VRQTLVVPQRQCLRLDVYVPVQWPLPPTRGTMACPSIVAHITNTGAPSFGSPPRCGIQSLSSDDATFNRIPVDRPNSTVPMMTIPPAIGMILILVGIVLFIVDLSVTNHGLLTAGGIVTLLAGGLALLGASPTRECCSAHSW
jgi:hypothetical protein